jgi:hypothetical protein
MLAKYLNTMHLLSFSFVEAFYWMINIWAWCCSCCRMQPFCIKEHGSSFQLIHQTAFHSAIESNAVGCLNLVNSHEDRKYHRLLLA